MLNPTTPLWLARVLLEGGHTLDLIGDEAWCKGLVTTFAGGDCGGKRAMGFDPQQGRHWAFSFDRAQAIFADPLPPDMIAKLQQVQQQRRGAVVPSLFPSKSGIS